MSALTEFAALRGQGAALARTAKAVGRKVVGYMGATTPIELFDAAGLVAVPITGNPGAPTPRADRYMETLFDPRVREALDSILAGAWRSLDLIVLPRTSDSQQRLYYYLCELARMGVNVPPAKLYDLLHTPGPASASYNLARTEELKADLEKLSGATIEEGRLRAAIASGNARRRALLALVALRRARPACLGGVEALDAFAASALMDSAAFCGAVERIQAESAGVRYEGPRIVVAGSVQDRPDIAALVAELGGVVVGDYHAAGEGMIGALVDEAMAPVEALSAHYHRTIVSSRSYPSDSAAITAFARAAGADGVLFQYDAAEEALTWDLPAQKRDLEAAGIPVLALVDQPRRVDRAALAAALGPFLNALAKSALRV